MMIHHLWRRRFHMGWVVLTLAVCGLLTTAAQAADQPGAKELYQLGVQSERAGYLDAALQHYEAAIDAGGDIRSTVGSLIRVAHIQMLRRADAEAEKAIDEALQRDPDNSEARLAQARLMLLRDKPRQAARMFEELSRREPVAIPSILGLIESALIRGEPALVKQGIARLKSSIGTNPQTRLVAAHLIREDAQFFSTVALFAVASRLAELAMELDPSHESKQLMAMMYYQANQLDLAAAIFQELLSVSKFQDQAGAMLNQIEVQRKELQLASKRAAFAALQARAREAEIAGRLQEAISAYEEMIAFGKDVFAVETREAESKLPFLRKRFAEKTATESRVQASDAMRAGRYEEAADLLKKAKIIVGTELVLDGMLAEALLKSSAKLDAPAKEKALREILDLEAGLQNVQAALPSAILAQTHAQLGVILESQKRWEEAVEQYEAARRGPPTLPDLSRRLFIVRLRANLAQSILILAGILVIVAGAFYQWPNAHRIVIAFCRHEMAIRRRDRDRQYHALSALAALLPHRIDLRRKLASMAEEKGDQDVCLYLYEQLRRERSLDRDGLLKLFDLYERRADKEKMISLIGDLMRETLESGVRARILETKFRLDLEASRTKDAIQTGRELMALKPTAWLAEQMAVLLRQSAAGIGEPELKALLSIYRAWIRLQPMVIDRIVGQLEDILKKCSVGRTGGEMDPEARQLTQFVLDLHLKSGNQKRATELLESMASVEKNPVPTLQSLLKIYTSLGEEEAVFLTLRRLYEAQPANFEFGMKYADAVLKRADEAGRESVLLNLLAHHPNSVELVNLLMEAAKAHFESDQPARLDRAAQILRAIISQTFLDTREARLLLARGLIKKGQMDEAIAILQALEGGGYPRLRAQSLAAEAFLRKNQPGLAVDILSKVNMEDPQMTEDLFKEIRYLQAEALEAQDRLEEAAAILDELILRDITFRDVKARHDRLSHVRRRSAPAHSCPSCNKPNPPGSRFCASCGSPMPASA